MNVLTKFLSQKINKYLKFSILILFLGCTHENLDSIEAKLTESKNDRILCAGDSFTEGGSPGSAYPVHLKDLLPQSTIISNTGMSGKMSAPIAIRYGGVKIFINNEIIMPNSGSVSGTYTRNKNTGRIDAFSYAASIKGISGIMSISKDTSTTFSFTRNNVGSSIYIPAGTEVITDDIKFHKYILIIWAGQNDLAFGWPTVDTAPVMSVQACVDAMDVEVKKFLVLGITTSYDFYKADITSQNKKLKETFPNNFIDMQSIFRTQGLQLAGINPTTEDLQSISNGLVPKSLLYDGLHPNDITKKKVVAQIIYQELLKRGWIANE